MILFVNLLLNNSFLEIALLIDSNVQLREMVILNKPAAQAAGQTLPDAPPPVGKIHSFSNIAVTFETIQRLRCPSSFRISEKMSK